MRVQQIYIYVQCGILYHTASDNTSPNYLIMQIFKCTQSRASPDLNKDPGFAALALSTCFFPFFVWNYFNAALVKGHVNTTHLTQQLQAAWTFSHKPPLHLTTVKEALCGHLAPSLQSGVSSCLSFFLQFVSLDQDWDQVHVFAGFFRSPVLPPLPCCCFLPVTDFKNAPQGGWLHLSVWLGQRA